MREDISGNNIQTQELRQQILEGIGETYENIGNPEKALQAFRAALRVAEERGERFSTRAHRGMSHAFRALGLYAEALQEGQKALRLARGSRDQSTERMCTFSVANALSAAGKPQDALDLLSQLHGNQSFEGIAADDDGFFLSLVAAYSELGDIHHAQQMAKRAYEAVSITSNPYNLASALQTLGTFSLEIDSREEAATYLVEASALASKIGASRVEAYAQLSLIDLYALSGDLVKQYGAYETCLVAATKSTDPRIEYQAHARMATRAVESGDKRTAILLLLKAADAANRSSRPDLKANSLMGAAAGLTERNEFEDALALYESSLMTELPAEYRPQLARPYVRCAESAGQLQRAVPIVEALISEFRPEGPPVAEELDMREGLGRFFLQVDRYDEAIVQLTRGIVLAHEAQHFLYESAQWVLLGNAHERMSEHENALRAYQAGERISFASGLQNVLVVSIQSQVSLLLRCDRGIEAIASLERGSAYPVPKQQSIEWLCAAIAIHRESAGDTFPEGITNKAMSMADGAPDGAISAPAFATLASSLVHIGRYASAAKYLLRASRSLTGSEPECADIAIGLGVCFANLGERVDAKRYFEVAHEIALASGNSSLAKSAEGYLSTLN